MKNIKKAESALQVVMAESALNLRTFLREKAKEALVATIEEEVEELVELRFKTREFEKTGGKTNEKSHHHRGRWTWA